MTTPPERTGVAARIADRLVAWHASAQPGEHTPYALLTVLDPTGREVARASLTYRQAEELAAWQAGVTSITCTPWALAAELRRWVDPAPAAVAAAVVFAEPDGSHAHPVALGADDDRIEVLA